MSSARKRLHPEGKLLNASLPKRLYVLSDSGSIFHSSTSPSASASASSASPPSSASSHEENITPTTSAAVAAAAAGAESTMQGDLYGFQRSHGLSFDLSTARIQKSETLGSNLRGEAGNLSLSIGMRGGTEPCSSMSLKAENSTALDSMRGAEDSTSGIAHLMESYHGVYKDPYHHQMNDKEPYHCVGICRESCHGGFDRENYSYRDPSAAALKSKGRYDLRHKLVDSDAEASDLTCEMNQRSCGYDLNSSSRMLHDVMGAEPYVNTRIHPSSKRSLGFLNSRASSSLSSSSSSSSRPFRATEDMAAAYSSADNHGSSSSSAVHILPSLVIGSGRHLDSTKWSYVRDEMESKKKKKNKKNSSSSSSSSPSSSSSSSYSSSSSMAEDMGSRSGFSSLFPAVGRTLSTRTHNAYVKAKSLAKASLGQDRDEGASSSQDRENPSENSWATPPSYVLSSGRKSLEEEARSGRRAPTIDQDFEEYFSSLML